MQTTLLKFIFSYCALLILVVNMFWSHIHFCKNDSAYVYFEEKKVMHLVLYLLVYPCARDGLSEENWKLGQGTGGLNDWWFGFMVTLCLADLILMWSILCSLWAQVPWGINFSSKMPHFFLCMYITSTGLFLRTKSEGECSSPPDEILSKFFPPPKN